MFMHDKKSTEESKKLLYVLLCSSLVFVKELKTPFNKSLTDSLCRLQRVNETGFVCFFLQRKPRVVQSLGALSVTAPPPETRLGSSHVSPDNNHSNSSNVVCTGKLITDTT